MSPPAGEETEPLAVLLLPSRLEQFQFAEHARELLSIPRVVALEPSRHRTPRMLRESAPVRQARRLRFPGRPVVLVLYHPEQYRLARALQARHEGAELWYFPANPDEFVSQGPSRPDELRELEGLARSRATPERTAAPEPASALAGSPLRRRLQELGVISHRPFLPSGRVRRSAG